MSQATPTTAGVVDTAKVAGRRTLRFESIDQMTAEVDRLVEAERAGRLRRVGNWTLGQTLGHLATWTEYAYTGAPLKPPFFIRWITALPQASVPARADAGRREDTRRGGRDVGDGARADGRSTGAVAAASHGAAQVRGPHRPERHFRAAHPRRSDRAQLAARGAAPGVPGPGKGVSANPPGSYIVSTWRRSAMKTHIVRIGNSRGVRIPKPLLEQTGVAGRG